MKVMVVFCVLLLTLGLIPGAAALNVVTTMPNLWDVAGEIGGDSVKVMYVAPPAAVHIASDTIDSLLQQNSEFIKNADVFLGQGGTMDGTVIAKVTEFREKNFGLETQWSLLSEVTAEEVPSINIAFDNPTALMGYSAGVAYLLAEVDPLNQEIYSDNLIQYIAKIDRETYLTAEEKNLFEGVPIICHFRIQNQAVNWLGMTPIDTYPQPTEMKDLIDDIHANPEKYKAIAESSKAGKIFVIENTVAGSEMGIGVHEALKDAGVPVERVIFLNLPKSAEGADTILDYYNYNKNLMIGYLMGANPSETSAPVGIFAGIIGIFGATLLFRRD